MSTKATHRLDPLFPSPKPIFIIGAPRSGTSVLTWSLGQHPNIIALPETNWIAALASHLDSIYWHGSNREEFTQLSAFNVDRHAFFVSFGGAIDELIRRSFEERFRSNLQAWDGARPGFYARFRSAHDPKQRWVDGAPVNTRYAIRLAELFPEARFINLIRDPIEVVRSYLGFGPRMQAHPSAASALTYIFNCTQAGYLVEAALGPERVIRVFHRSLGTPGEPIAKLLDFLGEPHCEDCLLPFKQTLNSSGRPTEETNRELDTLRGHALMASLREWYAAAQDGHWLVAKPQQALRALTRTAVPMPPKR